MGMPAARRLEREDRCADVAATLGGIAGRGEQMGDERRRRRLAIGAGDGDERRVGRDRPALAAVKLDVADHLDGGIAREPDRPVGRRMGERHAGREHERGNARPFDTAQVLDRKTLAGRFRRLAGRIVAGDHPGAAGLQRAAHGEAGRAEAEHRKGASGKGGERDHRSLRVERPASASTKATIQKRMTICGSVQPSFSK